MKCELEYSINRQECLKKINEIEILLAMLNEKIESFENEFKVNVNIKNVNDL